MKNRFADIPYTWTSFLHFIVSIKYVEIIVEIVSLLVRHRFLSSSLPIFIALHLVSIPYYAEKKNLLSCQPWVYSFMSRWWDTVFLMLFSCQSTRITHGFILKVLNYSYIWDTCIISCPTSYNFKIAADAELCAPESCEQIKVTFSHPWLWCCSSPRAEWASDQRVTTLVLLAPTIHQPANCG